MIRSLLTTTAIVAVLTAGAYAASHAVMPSGKPVFMTDGEAKAMESQNGYFSASEGQILASNLLGKNIYASAADDAETIGEVDDVVMSPNGAAEAVLIGVGGFLGIGEKTVAVDFEKLQWIERNGEQWLVLASSREELEAAPAFERAALVTNEPAMVTPVEEKPETNVAAKEVADNATKPVDTMAAQPVERVMTEVDAGTLSAERLIGTRVYGSDNKDLGEIGDVLVTADGKLDAYVIDVGGFLGIGEKPVALDASALTILSDESGSLEIRTAYTQEQLETQTAYTQEAYKADRNTVVLK
jgi:sporulation protein YlmC with PRC-barrel domain